MHTPVRVLFICDGGTSRSRMAAAQLRATAGNRFEVYGAGIEAEALHPLAIEVMREIDIRLDDTPTPELNDFEDMKFDYVIALCDEAKSSCLSFPADVHNLHWTVIDPSLKQGTQAEQLAAYRETRDDIRQQLRIWLDALGITE